MGCGFGVPTLAGLGVSGEEHRGTDHDVELRAGKAVSAPRKRTAEWPSHMPVLLFGGTQFGGVLGLFIHTAMGMTLCHRQGATSSPRRAWVEIR